MSSSLVSSFAHQALVAHHSKSSSDVAKLIVNEAIDDSVRKCLSAQICSEENVVVCDNQRKSITPSPNLHLTTGHHDQPMDLTTPSLGPSKSNEACMSSLHSSPREDRDDVQESEDPQLADMVKQQQIIDTTPLPALASKNSVSSSSTDSSEENLPQQLPRTSNKRKCDHPTKLDFSALPTKQQRVDPDMSNAVEAREFIRVATHSLKEHLSTTAKQLVEDVMNQLESYFCVASQNAPAGSKVSKGCQTEAAQSTTLSPQLHNLASTYSELLTSNGSNVNSSTNGRASPQSILSSMAQYGNLGNLYSPAPTSQNQAAAVAAALAATTNSGNRNGSSIANLLPSPVTNAFGNSGNGNSYQGVYNPYLANVFQSAAQALLQQQQQQQQHQQKQASNAAAAAILSNLNSSAAQNIQGNSTKAQKFSAASLAGQPSQSPVPQNASSSAAIDFSSMANFMAAAAAKRKRTKVTDTRLSARTARKLLDNSFQSGIAVCDADINVDGVSPEKRVSNEYQSSSQTGNEGEALSLVKADIEDFENDERLMLATQDDLPDQDDQELNGGESRISPNNGAGSSASSRVSVGPDDDDSSRATGLVSQSPMVLPFTPSRNHMDASSFLAEQSAALQQNGLAQLAFPMGKTSTLTSMHLRKAKLMFFYVRYPSSSVLKIYFPDVSFNKNNTAQLVKWFSNFREFYYINIEKYARQLVAEGVTSPDDVEVSRNSELFKVLNLHYNRNNQLQVPAGFSVAVRTTVREFMRAILLQKDQDPSWKKQIYKVIARLDEPLPHFFRDINWMHQLLSD